MCIITIPTRTMTTALRLNGDRRTKQRTLEPTWMMPATEQVIMLYLFIITGVDLSKILGGQTKILGGQKVVLLVNAWEFVNYWGSSCPGCPPKSTPMFIMHS